MFHVTKPLLKYFKDANYLKIVKPNLCRKYSIPIQHQSYRVRTVNSYIGTGMEAKFLRALTIW